MANSTVQQTISVGPFFAGDSGPSVDMIFLYDSGGYVDLTHSNIEVTIKRWDPRSKSSVGPVLSSGPAIVVDPLNGEAVFSWIYADPTPTVPVDSGWYVLQASVLLSSGLQQLSQRAIFEVIKP